jgi:hypothetical protein
MKVIPSFQKAVWSEGVVSKEAASLDHFFLGYSTTVQTLFQE